MKSILNITRFTYAKHSFLGWRLLVQRGGFRFLRYFSEKQFGGTKASLEAALAARDQLKPFLAACKLRNRKLTDVDLRKGVKILNR